MSEIQRYHNPSNNNYQLTPCKDGEYVLFTDHAKRVQEELEGALQKITKIMGKWQSGRSEVLLVSRAALSDDIEIALNGDASLGIEISGLAAIAWHLEQGHDNGKIGREALAKFLRGLEMKLKASRAALKEPLK